MVTLSSIFAWEVPWTEEPGRVQFMRSKRVRHDLVSKQQGQKEMSEQASQRQELPWHVGGQQGGMV